MYVDIRIWQRRSINQDNSLRLAVCERTSCALYIGSGAEHRVLRKARIISRPRKYPFPCRYAVEHQLIPRLHFVPYRNFCTCQPSHQPLPAQSSHHTSHHDPHLPVPAPLPASCPLTSSDDTLPYTLPHPLPLTLQRPRTHSSPRHDLLYPS